MPSTQQYLDIAEIREDVIILKDRTMRMVLMCSSINFSLKSEDEQNALIQSYMQFINSIDYPLQIVIQSRKLDIEGYLQSLQEVYRDQTNDLLKMQIQSYIDFINELVELGEIMTKSFFVVVHHDPLKPDQQRTFWNRLFNSLKVSKYIKMKKQTFDKYKEELVLKVNNVQANLNSLGLDAVVLDTASLIELYYRVYNPKLAHNQKIGETENLTRQ